jgi:hypothetical protein
MTPDDRDYDTIIRSALHAAAESVKPASDGLERIRHRLASPRHSSRRAHAFVAWLRRPAIGRLVRRGPAAAGLRPVLAVAGAVAIVVAGAFALGRVQQFIRPANSVTTSRPSELPSSARSSAKLETGPGSIPIGVEPGPATSGRSGSSPAGGLPPIARPPTPTPTTTPSPRAGAPSATMSVTPTPSDTATPTATPTPTTTPTSTSTSTPTATPTTTPTGTSAPTATPLRSTAFDRTTIRIWRPSARGAATAAWRVSLFGGHPTGPGQAVGGRGGRAAHFRADLLSPGRSSKVSARPWPVQSSRSTVDPRCNLPIPAENGTSARC